MEIPLQKQGSRDELEKKMMKRERNFASDNNSGACPEVLEVMEESNREHAAGYGDDEWTRRASDALREVFETDCEVFFVFNGTAANSLALSSTCRSYHSILCHLLAHLETDECGAPEFFSNGSKVLLLEGEHGKICPASIEEAVMRRTDLHYPKPKAVSVTQSTEVGTTYSLKELQLIGETCRKRDLKFHMDGARFANAVVESGLDPSEMIAESGVDILCFGSTKNGAMVGDAVIFFDRARADEFEYRCKQAGQLASKMRFLSSPWVALLKNDLWLKNARSANKRAEELYQGIREFDALRVLFPRQANSVFVELSESVQQKLKERGWRFYTFIGKGGCRFMCSWDTTAEDITCLISDLRELVEN